jgi:hypothetical protein
VRIVFARPRHTHDSYTDFRKLVEVSGFETCYYDEMDLSERNFYVVAPASGELRPAILAAHQKLSGPKRAVLTFWNLERPDSGYWPPEGNNSSNQVDDILKFVDTVWVSDRFYAEMDKRMIFVPMASDARLADGNPLPIKVYDLAVLAYANGRRQKIFGRLERWKVAPSTAWGETRVRILHSSRAMLYVHQTPLPIGAPLRFSLAAAYQLPVLSESMSDPYPLVEGRDFLGAPYEEIPDRLEDWLSSRLEPFGENLHHTLCVDLNFRGCVEEGVRRTLSGC